MLWRRFKLQNQQSMRRVSLGRQRQERMGLSGKPKHIVLPKYGNKERQMGCFECCLDFCGEWCGFLRTYLPCVCCCFIRYPYQTVEQNFEGILQKFGDYTRTLPPGLHFVNPCSQTVAQVDMRLCTVTLSEQNIMTYDNICLKVSTTVYYQVISSRYAYFRVQDYHQAVEQITYAILKNTFGKFILDDVLAKRQDLVEDMERQVDTYVSDWGINIIDILIRDLRIDDDLATSLSMAAREQREALSKVIMAKAEVQAAKLMRLAAEELNSKAAMQIRYLQSLKAMGEANNEKIIFIPERKQNPLMQHIITQAFIMYQFEQSSHAVEPPLPLPNHINNRQQYIRKDSWNQQLPNSEWQRQAHFRVQASFVSQKNQSQNFSPSQQDFP